MRPLILVAAALLTFPAMASGQQTGDQGSVLYIRKGCLGCHGASGRGGVGPALANTQLTPEAFVNQLRHPRGIMPPFHQRIVSDARRRRFSALSSPRPRHLRSFALMFHVAS